MPLVFITGQAGTGKTTILEELRRRGFDGFDVDNDGLARWRNKQTGYLHPKSTIKPEDRTKKFISEHTWYVPPHTIADIGAAATHKPIFICGWINNEIEMRDFFIAKFALVLDDETLTHRLLSRPGERSWGKQPHELQDTLSRQKPINERFAKAGYNIIDANHPVGEIVDTILNETRIKSDEVI